MISQRVYLLKVLHEQGLSRGQLHIVFLALISLHPDNVMPCHLLSREHVGQINAFLKRICRCGFLCELIQLETLTLTVDKRLLRKCMARFTAFILCCHLPLITV